MRCNLHPQCQPRIKVDRGSRLAAVKINRTSRLIAGQGWSRVKVGRGYTSTAGCGFFVRSWWSTGSGVPPRSALF